MAERAILAVGRPDGRCAVATSRWGGTDRALAAVCAGTEPSGLPGVSWTYRESAPDFVSLATHLDYLSTAALYRTCGGETTVFLPLWFGLPLADLSPSPTAGALVAVDSVSDARTLRRQFRRLKGHLADAVVAGHAPVPVAVYGLWSGVAGLSDRERVLSPLPGRAEVLYQGEGPDRP